MLSWNQTRKQSLFPPLPSCYFLTVKQKLEQNDQHQTLSAVLVSIDSSVPKTPTFQSRLFCWHRKTSTGVRKKTSSALFLAILFFI
uniref:Uncharacterized protein MANES_02G076400 n=1 Tax=Rhizophora mucronata TaxID=61149 RepID=A0A2P2M730_RHIMU